MGKKTSLARCEKVLRFRTSTSEASSLSKKGHCAVYLRVRSETLNNKFQVQKERAICCLCYIYQWRSEAGVEITKS